MTYLKGEEMNYHATLDNTSGYTQADLDRFNAALDRFLESHALEPENHFTDQDMLAEAVDAFSARHLTDEPSEWPF